MVETRTITQTLVWKLILNPMRDKTETTRLVAWSDDRDKLLAWYNSQKTEPYKDNGSPSFESHGDSHSWFKCFTKGSNLEWFNPMDSEDGTPNCFGQGIQSEWVDSDYLPEIRTGYRVS